jgi:hypothetical protein
MFLRSAVPSDLFFERAMNGRGGRTAQAKGRLQAGLSLIDDDA